jgi:hypothetical protein
VFNKADKTYVGFLDIRDLVSFIRFVYDEQKVQDNGTLHGTNTLLSLVLLPTRHRPLFSFLFMHLFNNV